MAVKLGTPAASDADANARYGAGYSGLGPDAKFATIKKYLDSNKKELEDYQRTKAGGDQRLREINDRIGWAYAEWNKLHGLHPTYVPEVDEAIEAPAGTPTSAELAASYGWSEALLNSDPELRNLFNQAAAEGWTADRFGARMRDTKWYTTRSEAQRRDEVLKYVDPKEHEVSRDPKVVAETYNLPLALLNSNPELKTLFDKAVGEVWSPDRFTAELRNTQWYSTHSDAWRQNEILKYGNPEEFETSRDPRVLADAYGLPLDLLNANPELKTLFDRAVGEVWNPDRFAVELRNTQWYSTRSAAQRQGEILRYADPEEFETSRDPKVLANSYGLPLALLNSNPELKSLFDRAVAGAWNPDRFTAELSGTQWFTTKSAGQRRDEILKYGDPKEFESSHDPKVLAADYGWSLALLNSDPELKTLFDRAVGEAWSPARFTAELAGTQWFTTHQESWRQNEALRYADPKEFEARKTTRLSDLRDVAASMGGAASEEVLQRIANDSMMFGWSDSQVRDALGKYIQIKQSGTLGGQYIGDAGRNYTTLMGLARKNGYKIPDGKIESWLQDIGTGDASVQDYGDFIRRQAAAMYPAWSDELLAGADLEDLVSPYRSSMANLLEIPESTIDLNDRLLAGAMGQRKKSGTGGSGPAGKFEVMPLFDFEDQIRADDRWQYTDNAHEKILGSGQKVLQMMGFR